MTIRKLPTLIAALFIWLTVDRMASLFHEALGATENQAKLIALGLAGSIFLASYFSKAHDSRAGKETPKSMLVRKAAFKLLIFFLLADGLFNLAEANRAVDYTWKTPLLMLGVQVFGLLPTASGAALGYLQGLIDSLPVITRQSGLERFYKKWEKRIKKRKAEKLAEQKEALANRAGTVAGAATQSSRNGTKPAKKKGAYLCACGTSYENHHQLNGHKGKCEVYKLSKKEGDK